jgi:GNAT superfamily N-acetyltransferase
MALVDVVVTYLEMTAPEQLRPAAAVASGVTLRRELPPASVDLAAQLYRLVGSGYRWLDRLSWGEGEWREAIDTPGVELWTAREGETIVGYFELERRELSAEIRYFGLAPGFLGRGLGGWLLTEAVRRAWQLGAPRVTVNTCTLDGTAALPNYRSRGFVVVREDLQRREVST